MSAREKRAWQRIRGDRFGDWIEARTPECDMVLICADHPHHEPVTICLRHQAYVEKLREIMHERGVIEVTLMPYRNADKVTITLDDLRRRRKA